MVTNAKKIFTGDDARVRLLDGIGKMAGAVKSTLGPMGRTVLIESDVHTRGLVVTKDGVTVAKSVVLSEPVEDLAVRIMREASERTAALAGDGTTTAIVLAEALVRSGMEMMGVGDNRVQILRDVVDMGRVVVEELRGMSRAVRVEDVEMLRHVATISANNDGRMGSLISDVFSAVGGDGIVTVERSQSGRTYTEVTHGFRVQRGYVSPLFINDQRRDECVYDDVMVLVSDAEIHNLLQIEQVLKPVIQENKRLLIIAPMAAGVVNTLALNVVKNGLRVVAIQPPSFGYRQQELMGDIAVALGAKYFSERTGDDLSLLTYADLGHAAKVIVGREQTVIVNSDIRTDAGLLGERVRQLRGAYEDAGRREDRDFISERIGALTGGVGVIFVGGTTDVEQKELYDRVDDAVCAVRAALEEGIIPGSGKPLYALSRMIGTQVHESRERSIAGLILASTLKVPMEQIMENAGVDVNSLLFDMDNPGEGMNLYTGEVGDLIGMGVIDPLKVTRSAVENAISVATTILSTDSVVTLERQ